MPFPLLQSLMKNRNLVPQGQQQAQPGLYQQGLASWLQGRMTPGQDSQQQFNEQQKKLNRGRFNRGMGGLGNG
jgi:hypothetical protein